MARALGMDPVAFRLKNILLEGSERSTGNRMPPGTAARECLEAVARAAGWSETGSRWTKPTVGCPPEPHKRRGIGVACAYKNVGYSFGFDDKSTARVHLRLGDGGDIDSAVIHTAAIEVGQGVLTVLAQIAAQTLGIELDRVHVAFTDTATSPDAGSCSASRLTYMAGNAVYGACLDVAAKRDAILLAETGELGVEAEYTYHARSYRPTTDWDPDTGACDPHISYGWGAQVALVEVDVETGEVQVLGLWAASNVGKAINPAALFGQSAGGVAMGVGYALSEEIVHQGARLRTRRFSEYHVPTALDIPERFVDIQVECPDPTGPYGATGVGEVPVLATAPAVLNAIADVVGVYIDVLPVTPERVWRSICGQPGLGDL
jgi:CO/xanthine dehydrogenase Mo-binding subunit